MGMTRAVGFGFLLLLVVTHASGEANIRQTTVSGLSPNEHYLVPDAAEETTISDAKVGDKVVLVVDGATEGLTWVASSTPAQESVVSTFKQFRKTSDEGNVLSYVEIVPAVSGEHKFEIRRNVATGVRSSRVGFGVSQGSRFVLPAFPPEGDAYSVTSRPNEELSIVFRDFNINGDRLTLESSPGLTTFEIQTNEYPDQAFWVSWIGDYYASLKVVRTTPKTAGSHTLKIKWIRNSDNTILKTKIINIIAETATTTPAETATTTPAETATTTPA